MTRPGPQAGEDADALVRIAEGVERIAAALERLSVSAVPADADAQTRPVVAPPRSPRARRAPTKRTVTPVNPPSELDRARAREMLAKRGLLERKP